MSAYRRPPIVLKLERPVVARIARITDCAPVLIDHCTAENSEALLEAAARAYVNYPRGVRNLDGDLMVSSIYVWFAEDFGTSDAQIITHLARYAEPDLASALGRVSEIDDHRYDWTLNRTGP